MSYIFFKNRGTQAENRRNSNKLSKLRVPHASWDSLGQKAGADDSIDK